MGQLNSQYLDLIRNNHMARRKANSQMGSSRSNPDQVVTGQGEVLSSNTLNRDQAGPGTAATGSG